MPKSSQSQGIKPRRILVRGVNWLGDAVMTTAALQRLRERFPNASLALLTQKKLADLWLHHPAIDEMIGFGPGESSWAVARRIRAHAFDLAVVLPNSPRSALEVWLARIPLRIGYARPWRNWWLTRAVPARPGHVRMRKRSVREIKNLVASNAKPKNSGYPAEAHQIHDYLHLIAALGANPEPLAPRLEVTATELQQAQARVVSEINAQFGNTPASQPWTLLGLNPGAEYGPAKRWPPENFAVVAREVSKKIGNCVWLAFGGTNDRNICEEISRLSGIPMLNLAGKTSLRELMSLLKLCRVLLTNDTGPMHLAAALGTPVVVPFGSTSPELTGPGLPGDKLHRLLSSGVPCAPCFRRECPIDFRCMTTLPPERVSQAVLGVVSRS